MITKSALKRYICRAIHDDVHGERLGWRMKMNKRNGVGVVASIAALVIIGPVLRELARVLSNKRLIQQMRSGDLKERDLMDHMISIVVYNVRKELTVLPNGKYEDEKGYRKLIQDARSVKTIKELREFAKKYGMNSPNFYYLLDEAEKIFNERKRNLNRMATHDSMPWSKPKCTHKFRDDAMKGLKVLI